MDIRSTLRETYWDGWKAGRHVCATSIRSVCDQADREGVGLSTSAVRAALDAVVAIEPESV